MDLREQATALLEEFNLCMRSQPKHNAVELQIEKDSCARWAYNLNNQLAWGNELDIAEACYQLEPRLAQLKQKVIIEILQYGTI